MAYEISIRVRSGSLLARLLEIYRVFYDYISIGRDKKMPAMRLGPAEQ